jgi:hypothetical protein
MKTAKINDILMFEGKLVKVIGIAEGKMIIMEPVIKPISFLTVEDKSIYVLEHSPNFQNVAEPVQTLTDNQ